MTQPGSGGSTYVDDAVPTDRGVRHSGAKKGSRSENVCAVAGRMNQAELLDDPRIECPRCVTANDV